MSITVVNAKIYVARIIGGGADSQESLDMAGEAILRAYQDWQNKKFWRFLRKDTSLTTAVTATVTKNSAVVSAPSSGALDFVNIGQTVTYSGSAGTLAASTTVSSYTRNSDGTIATITLSNAFGGGSYTTESGTLTFSANIPIIAGTNDYNLPLDYDKAYNARTLTVPRLLTWRDQDWWDRQITDPSVRGTPEDFTTYNAYSDATQNFGTKHLKFDRIPDVADTLLLRYYRRFNPSGTYVDMPDDYLYLFLDYCRTILLETKTAQDNPQAYGEGSRAAAEGAAEDDENTADNNDFDETMKSQYEMGFNNRRLWNNGDFEPYPY